MSRHFARAPGVLSRHTAGRVLLLPPAAERPVELAGTGVLVWELLARPRSEEDLAAVLGDRYGLAPSAIVKDIRPALRALEQSGAIRSEP